MHCLARALILGSLLALAACAAPPTPYQPAVSEASYGYSSAPIDPTTWRISFKGNAATERTRVEDYVLYRSAELALEQGARGFVVLMDDIEKDVAYYGTGYPYNGYGYVFYRGFSNGRRNGYRSRGFYDGGPSHAVNRYTGLITIRLYRREAPEGIGPAFDARELVSTLGPRITRPEDLG